MLLVDLILSAPPFMLAETPFTAFRLATNEFSEVSVGAIP